MQGFFHKQGFTTIEALLALCILVLVTRLVYSSFSVFRNRQFLETNTRNVVSLIEEARSLTLSSRGGSSFGVHFDSDRAVRFSGLVYSSGSASNVVAKLDVPVTLSLINITGGGSDVVFNKIKGTTDTSGTLELSLVASSSIKKIITVRSTGIVDVQ